jgi:hypothetical protein
MCTSSWKKMKDREAVIALHIVIKRHFNPLTKLNATKERPTVVRWLD